MSGRLDKREDSEVLAAMRKIKIKWKIERPDGGLSIMSGRYKAIFGTWGPVSHFIIGIMREGSERSFYWSITGHAAHVSHFEKPFSELIKDVYGVEMERTV